MSLIEIAERGHLPDALIRVGIRRLLRQRLQALEPPDCETEQQARETFLERLRESRIALHTDDANEQHYELPAKFFELVLGRHLKYSCCEWSTDCKDLDTAEAAMLARTAERAELGNGQRVLELGCGWGSLTLWAAERHRDSSFLAVSNSSGQRAFIENAARERGLDNVRVVTADMNDFEPEGTFDRIVSVEMLEHMRNWPALLGRLARWLEPEGSALVHVFCHRSHAYLFETDGDDNWMGRYFFTGGLMPSDELMHRVQGDLFVDHHWRHSGHHYQRTAEAWLNNFDAKRDQVLPVLEQTYGPELARTWLGRWRMFFLACSELFGFRNGDEWWVSHYRLRKPADRGGRS